MAFTEADVWDRELKRILQVRSQRDVNDQVMREQQARYAEVGAQIGSTDVEALLSMEETLTANDARLFAERQAALLKRLDALGDKPSYADAVKHGTDDSDIARRFTELVDAAKAAVRAGDCEAANAALAELKQIHDGAKGLPNLHRTDRQPLSADEVAAVRERPDLLKHVARSDTWGNFDVARALDGDPQHALVLHNVLASALEAQREEETWHEYARAIDVGAVQAEVEGHVLPADARLDKEVKATANEVEEVVQLMRDFLKWNRAALVEGSELKARFDEACEQSTRARQAKGEMMAALQAWQKALETGDGKAEKPAVESTLATTKQALAGLWEGLLGELRDKIDAAKERGLTEQADNSVVYKTAILGAGASSAYHITNANLDLTQTVLIGQADPWAGERGGGDGSVINHPLNMISAEGRPDFDGGLAERAAFAEHVAQVVARVPHQCDGKILRVTKVEQGGVKVHAIQTSKGTYLAKQVISALGIGPHIDRLEADWEGHENDVRDMDSFMREVDELGTRADTHRIAVSGGNAAIDVITALMRNPPALVYWFCGSSPEGPMFLPGTDNDIAKEAYDAATSGGHPRLHVHPGRWSVKKEGGEIKMVKGTEEVVVDEVVYGVGPNVRAVQQLIDPSCYQEEDDATPAVYDRDQHFRLSLFERNPNRLLDHLEIGDEDTRAALLEIMGDPSLADEGLVADAMQRWTPEADPHRVTDFSVIGGQQSRMERRDRTGPLDALARYNDAVTGTLPANVVVGDQLTSSRARVEADQNAMPLVSDPGGVNFVTCNQTVLATHIAECYPAIPAGLADYLTAQIVVSRTAWTGERAPLPAREESDDNRGERHLRQQQAFQDTWRERLRQINGRMPRRV